HELLQLTLRRDRHLFVERVGGRSVLERSFGRLEPDRALGWRDLEPGAGPTCPPVFAQRRKRTLEQRRLGGGPPVQLEGRQGQDADRALGRGILEPGEEPQSWDDQQ